MKPCIQTLDFHPTERISKSLRHSIPVPLVEANSFSFDLEALEARISERTKILILNSPANPTGGVISKPDLEAIAALAQKHDFPCIERRNLLAAGL